MIETQKTGSKDGKDIFVYTFSSEAGGCMKVTNYGGTIMSVEMPDADGNRADVVLGFETPEEYFGGHPFLAQQSGGMPTGSQTAGSRWAERITPSRATKTG